MSERIGVAGLGRMGGALAARLAGQGRRVSGWTRSGGNPALAEAGGYALSPSLAALVEASDTILLSLFDDAAVADVLGQLAALDLTGRLLVETSTVHPDTTRAGEAAVTSAGGRLIDAPISGGPEIIATGTIGLFVGGAEADVERFLSVAQLLSDRVAHVGALGDGAAAKIVNNLALAGAIGAYLDAIATGAKLGLSFDTMLNFLEKSPATNPMFRDRLPKMRGEDPTTGFAIDGALKDAKLFMAVAESVGVSPNAMRSARGAFEAAVEAGLGEKDPAIAIRRAAGLE